MVFSNYQSFQKTLQGFLKEFLKNLQGFLKEFLKNLQGFLKAFFWLGKKIYEKKFWRENFFLAGIFFFGRKKGLAEIFFGGKNKIWRQKFGAKNLAGNFQFLISCSYQMRVIWSFCSREEIFFKMNNIKGYCCKRVVKKGQFCKSPINK